MTSRRPPAPTVPLDLPALRDRLAAAIVAGLATGSATLAAERLDAPLRARVLGALSAVGTCACDALRAIGAPDEATVEMTRPPRRAPHGPRRQALAAELERLNTRRAARLALALPEVERLAVLRALAAGEEAAADADRHTRTGTSGAPLGGLPRAARDALAALERPGGRLRLVAAAPPTRPASTPTATCDDGPTRPGGTAA